MPRTYVEDPETVARYETAGWGAYYDRNWPRAFWLLVRLNRDAFRMSWFNALAAALDTVRASIAFAPLEGNDIAKAREHIGRFYEKARRSLDMSADAQTLAELEIDYWIVHRELALRRKQDHEDDDIEPMVKSLTALHAALFDAPPEAMRPSAEWRAQAAMAVDRITGHYSEDVEEDWRRVEEYLQNAYRAVKAEVQTAEAVGDTIRAAQSMMKTDREKGLASLNDLFHSGLLPVPPPNGRYDGELVALDIAPVMTQLAQSIAGRWMPWQGKTFDKDQRRGDNIFRNDSLKVARLYWPLYRGYEEDGSNTYRAFAFCTWVGPGLADPDREVLKIDYDLPSNPGFSIRRVLDELVQVADGLYLGKAHLKWWWGKWQLVAYFSLTAAA